MSRENSSTKWKSTANSKFIPNLWSDFVVGTPLTVTKRTSSFY